MRVHPRRRSHNSKDQLPAYPRTGTASNASCRHCHGRHCSVRTRTGDHGGTIPREETFLLAAKMPVFPGCHPLYRLVAEPSLNGSEAPWRHASLLATSREQLRPRFRSFLKTPATPTAGGAGHSLTFTVRLEGRSHPDHCSARIRTGILRLMRTARCHFSTLL